MLGEAVVAEGVPQMETAEKDLMMPEGLAVVLKARDRRDAKRRALLTESGGCVLTVTLLMPGNVKTNNLSRAFLREYCSYLRKQLIGQGFGIVHEEALADSGGDAYFFAFAPATKPERLKHFAILMEEECEWARVLDLDLYVSAEEEMSRASLERPQRRCLICSESAHACSRSRRHDVLDLQEKVRSFQIEGLLQLVSERMQSAAIAAAVMEVLVTPKPGLVTSIDSGSHPDMDRFTYANSIAALAGYFSSAAICGLEEALERKEGLTSGSSDRAAELQRLGLRAERRMFAATEAVNTQKGFIYLSGITLAAAATLVLDPNLLATFEEVDEALIIKRWQDEISRWTLLVSQAPAATGNQASTDSRKIQDVSAEAEETTGESLNRLHGISGVRGEAASGLKSVFDLALPFYRALRRRSISKNDAAAITLLLLLAAVEDTTLIKRAGLQAAREIREEIAEFFTTMAQTAAVCPSELAWRSGGNERGLEYIDQVAEKALSPLCLDQIAEQRDSVISYIELWSDLFRQQGYSGGGAADLLAVTLLVLKLLLDI